MDEESNHYKKEDHHHQNIFRLDVNIKTYQEQLKLCCFRAASRILDFELDF